ncbi:unnamed protein product, partial [Phaeothamnion confervicola]
RPVSVVGHILSTGRGFASLFYRQDSYARKVNSTASNRFDSLHSLCWIALSVGKNSKLRLGVDIAFCHFSVAVATAARGRHLCGHCRCAGGHRRCRRPPRSLWYF